MTSISYDEPVLIEPGATIANKYRVTRILGEGGMGLVYEAKHEARIATITASAAGLGDGMAVICDTVS